MAATPSSSVITPDILIIGSGLAGLFSAIKASDKGLSVALLTKLDITDSNSNNAQGGVACKTLPDDTFESHIQDTLKAGAGLCNQQAVEHIIRAAPARMADLIKLGVQFTTKKAVEGGAPPPSVSPSVPALIPHGSPSPLPSSSTGSSECLQPEALSENPLAGVEYDLGKEGGHSARRVLHAGDITGREIIKALKEVVEKRPNITIYRNHIAVDLISSMRIGWPGPNTCLGAYALDKEANLVKTFVAKKTILATGGAGKVYLYTTNPDCASGDGIAMAWRAHADIANMEFFQFHPTCLFHPKVRNFLISEALRGEQAKLKIKNKDGKFVEFMKDYHPLADLAPRDIVARAIDNELKKYGQQCVYLDIRHHTEEFLRKRFPNIFEKLLELGIDMSRDMIPVVPAAHFCCGGVRTDISAKTTLGNLYAVGECACTGLHGANRLASNSLLECVVMGANAVDHAAASIAAEGPSAVINPAKIPTWTTGHAVDSDEMVVITHNWEEIRRFMWDYVGIFRTSRRLQRAKHRIVLIRREIEQYYWDFKITSDLLELRNLASVAEMIIDCALSRQESIGLHYNADFPPPSKPDASWAQVNTVLRRPISVQPEYFQVPDVAGNLRPPTRIHSP